MSNIEEPLSFKTATGRWSGLGPYYAMFPRDFAFQVVEKYSQPGEAVLDPFAGRASSVYAAAVLDRLACGIEINPVGWLYGHVKLQPAQKNKVIQRLRKLNEVARSLEADQLDELPEFFHICYCPDVLRYLIVARDLLKWKTSITDATLMAIILVNLHGRREQSLSNQMRQGKSMAPDYSVRWWQERALTPPEIDPVEFLIKRIEWRYQKGITQFRQRARVILGDSTNILNDFHKKINFKFKNNFSLLFTSPPYYNITNYHYDQWLRLWMLGGSEHPTWISEKWKNGFQSKTAYRELLQIVFQKCAEVMKDSATIYVRTDARQFTFETTLEILKNVFPEKSIDIISRPFHKNTQTALFGDKSKKPGEYDILMI